MLGLNLVVLLAVIVCSLALCAPLRGGEPLSAEIRLHKGRPTVFINGRPEPLPTYSPRGWSPDAFKVAVPRFFPHKMGAYFLVVPRPKTESDFWADPFWRGDQISNVPLYPPQQLSFMMDEQAECILKGDPDAHLILRFGMHEPWSWRKLHEDQYFVNDDGQVLDTPSMASELFWDAAAREARCLIEYSETRPWSDRIIGYANFHRMEGTHDPLLDGWLFDHSAVMTQTWRNYLKDKYGTVEKLRAAYGAPDITFENAAVPRDKLRGKAPEVWSALYWQDAKDNQPLRDYLLLQRDLFHRGFHKVMEQSCAATDRKRFIVYDALKQTMLGWNLCGFFQMDRSWSTAYPETLAGSGHMNVTELYGRPGFDGLITPHDYQARGVGGVYEPEGIVDSIVLHGKYFLSEMDTRSYSGADPHYGCARDDREFAAVTWRNLATSLTRGFNSYWMDLQTDWFATEEIHRVIQRQVEVIKQSVDWPHETVPGIAMILDDSAVLETNGAGNFFNEAVMWEQKMGMARCGVPHRIYMMEDLQLDNFPRHRVYYFPNLFRVDEERLALLRRKVFRDGNVVVWGPGSGISDGTRTGPESASKLTGFSFEYLRANYPRRTIITNFEHPITRGLAADTIFGGTLSYGPLLFPRDGTWLGLAWTKQGCNYCGLAVKSFGRGAAGAYAGKEPLGEGDYDAVFTSAVPAPADLWRGIARYAGAHVYCETNDVLMADSSVVALHSIQSGEKQIMLPGQFAVLDIVSGEMVSQRADAIKFRLEAPETRVFLLREAQ